MKIACYFCGKEYGYYYFCNFTDKKILKRHVKSCHKCYLKRKNDKDFKFEVVPIEFVMQDYKK